MLVHHPMQQAVRGFVHMLHTAASHRKICYLLTLCCESTCAIFLSIYLIFNLNILLNMLLRLCFTAGMDVWNRTKRINKGQGRRRHWSVGPVKIPVPYQLICCPHNVTHSQRAAGSPHSSCIWSPAAEPPAAPTPAAAAAVPSSAAAAPAAAVAPSAASGRCTSFVTSGSRHCASSS